jgi:hypothetical protein
VLAIDDILKISSPDEFEQTALRVFAHQAATCAPYGEYLDAVGISAADIERIATAGRIDRIPFLPIELFKTHRVYCAPTGPETVFASSGTGESGRSRHHIARLSDYRKSYTRGFELFYGRPDGWEIYALLPGYIENKHSSLIEMVRGLGGRFYLDDTAAMLRDMAAGGGSDSATGGKRKLLIGVSYALLDLAETGAKLPPGTVVMETGGMKGRREEISKSQLHSTLKAAFGVPAIHSEYGMAELMSQAYSTGTDPGTAQGNGTGDPRGEAVFRTPPWMRVLIRDTTDPFDVKQAGHRTGTTPGTAQSTLRGGSGNARGGINIIDLANLHSCAFIQTQDMGTLMADGGFTVDGRIARSDIRGCNLLVQ